ncbi:hypothetical protein ES703_31422 [subsurface metagenome]
MIIRSNKTWRNTGGAGSRDITAAYGTGTTLETFVMEFGTIRLGRYCAAGAQVITPVDCLVPEDAIPGLKNALVGVGKYDPGTGVITLDDYDIVPDAIEVMPGLPPQGAMFEIQDFRCTPSQACAVSSGETPTDYVNVLFDIVNVGDESGLVYEVLIGTSGWMESWKYNRTVAPGDKLHVDFYLGVVFAMWHSVTVYVDYDGDGVKAPEDKVYKKENAFLGIEC